jgi:hypothetical protein
MAKYITGNNLGGTAQAITTTYKSIVSVLGAASAPRRTKIYEMMLGTVGTPADLSYEWDISAQTADDGTKTNVTPNPLDQADAACVSLSRANFSVEGTVTAISARWYESVNQRASYRWIASPGSELVTPATANTGLLSRARSVSGGTAAVACSLYFEEQ